MVHGVLVQEHVEGELRLEGGILEEILRVEDNLASKDRGKKFNFVRLRSAQS